MHNSEIFIDDNVSFTYFIVFDNAYAHIDNTITYLANEQESESGDSIDYIVIQLVVVVVGVVLLVVVVCFLGLEPCIVSISASISPIFLKQYITKNRYQYGLGRIKERLDRIASSIKLRLY